MNGAAYIDEGLSLEKLGLDPAADATAEVVDEEPESSMMDEDYAEDEDELDEAWSEEDERPTQYDLRQYGVYQSLPIPGGPPDLQSDCTTAEEYIKRVRSLFCTYKQHEVHFTQHGHCCKPLCLPTDCFMNFTICFAPSAPVTSTLCPDRIQV